MGSPGQSPPCDPSAQRNPDDRPSKVYVAGSSLELQRAELAIAALERRGIIVTSTWPIVVRDTPGGANPADATREERSRWSRSEERRVGKECTVLCRSRWSPYH